MISKDPPVLEPGDGVLDASAPTPMSTPGVVAKDAASLEDGGDELLDPPIAAVGEDASVVLAQALDDRATVEHRIVAVAGASALGGDHVEVRTTDEDLRIARPPVVLGFRSGRVVTRRNQRPIDDPGPPAIRLAPARQQRGDTRADVDDDAMGLRAGDLEHGGELAHGQIGAQTRATDRDPALEWKRPGPAAPMQGAAELADHCGEL